MKKRLVEILDNRGGPYGDWTAECCGGPDDFTLKWGAMYEAPTLNAALLMELVEFFGTKNIDVDRYSEGGCESCDWGSDYGHEIRVRGAARGFDEAVAWAARRRP